jgi:enoyl-CoA hydratase
MIETTDVRGVAVLTMCRGKANALDTEFCREMVRRLDELEQGSARAVVITGRGTIFSAGVDLVRAGEGGPEYLRAFLPELNALFERVFFHPKPVVAAVNGHAIAGGCVLACAADRRLMAHGAGMIGVTELSVGVPFPAIAFEIMRFAAASDRLPEVVLTGRRYVPEEAAARGLVDAVVQPEGLLDRAIAEAEALGSLASATFRLTKQQLRQPVRERLQREGQAIDAAAEAIWLAPETAALMRDYAARTFKKS